MKRVIVFSFNNDESFFMFIKTIQKFFLNNVIINNIDAMKKRVFIIISRRKYSKILCQIKNLYSVTNKERNAALEIYPLQYIISNFLKQTNISLNGFMKILEGKNFYIKIRRGFLITNAKEDILKEYISMLKVYEDLIRKYTSNILLREKILIDVFIKNIPVNILKRYVDNYEDRG